MTGEISTKILTSEKTGSTVSRFCSGAMESVILVLTMAVPLHFSVLSQHIFENHKNALLRAGAIVLAGLFIVYAVDRWQIRRISLIPRRSIMRPLLLFLAAIALSCLFSIGQVLSFWGEIFRQVGLLTELSCIGIFVLILTFFRRPDQFQRLVTVFILTSVPISIYAFAQHYGPDPMPWKGNVGARCVSTLGNAVFLGAFQVMVFFPTLARVFDNIMAKGRQNARYWNAAMYAVIALAQIISAWHTKSRGPGLALLAGLMFFAIFMARGRLWGSGPKFLKFARVGAGIIAGIGAGMSIALLASYFADQDAVFARIYLVWPVMALAGTGFLIAIPSLDKTFKWKAIAFSVFLAAILMIMSAGINIAEVGHADNQAKVKKEVVKKDPWGALKRGGSVRTRVYIWEGFISIFFSTEPILYATTKDGGALKIDPFTWVRPLVGFGQETVGTVFRQRYPLKLLKKLPPSETADRAHNDILQRLVSTGVLGLFAYLFLLWAIFAYGLSAIGYSMIRKNRKTFAIFFWGGAFAGGIGGLLFGFFFKDLAEFLVGHELAGGKWALIDSGPAFCGVGVQMGLIFGVLVYCLFGEIRNKIANNAKTCIAAGLFCGLIANVTETTVAFPFTSTRLYFWMFAGLLVVMATRRLATAKTVMDITAPKPAPLLASKAAKKAKKQKPVQVKVNSKGFNPPPGRAVAAAILCGMIVSVVAFDFLGHQWAIVHSTRGGHVLEVPDSEAVAGMGILRTAKTDPADYRAQTVMVRLELLFLPWLFFCVFVFLRQPDVPDKIRWGDRPIIMGASIMVVLTALAAISLHAGAQMSGRVFLNRPTSEILPLIVDQSMGQANRIWVLYLWLGAWSAILAWTLMKKKSGLYQDKAAGKIPARTIITAIVVCAAILPVIWRVSVRPVVADVLTARGMQWKQGRAAPNIGTEIDGQRLSRILAVAHVIKAAKSASFISAHQTDLASTASILAQKTPKGKSFFGEKPPLGQDLGGLLLADLGELSREDAEMLAQCALFNSFDINPADPQNAMNLARLYSQWGHLTPRKHAGEKRDQAMNWYDKARKMMPTNAHVESEIAKFLFVDKRNPKKALEYLERSLAIDDTHLKTHLLMADVRMALLKKKCGKALTSAMTLHKGPEVEPGPECRAGLDEIAKLMERSLELRPKKADSLVRLAGVFINARKPQKAVAALERGLAVLPGNKSLMTQLVFICKKEKDFRLGLDLFDRLIEKKPESAGLYIASAQFLGKMGLKKEIPEHLEKALALAPEKPGLNRQAAMLYAYSGLFKKAEKCIEKALLLQPRKSANWLAAADVYEKSKRYLDSARALERAAKMTSNTKKRAAMYKKTAILWRKAKKPSQARRVEKMASALKK